MTDTISKSRRSANMAAIRSKDTTPELIVRRLVTALGYRYRLHRRDLPGKPDLVFGPRRKVIFVHGCFWHLHPAKACLDARFPKSNKNYWTPKLNRNAARDQEHVAALRTLGWRVLIIWDCETRNTIKTANRLRNFLGPE
jgi:DNA mismatch endonuclease, patch repair protein